MVVLTAAWLTTEALIVVDLAAFSATHDDQELNAMTFRFTTTINVILLIYTFQHIGSNMLA